MNTVMFSKDWKKLNNEIFTTIRSSKNEKFHDAEEGTIWLVRTPTHRFQATLLLNLTMLMDELSTALLTCDTDTETRTEAIREINSFYKYAPEHVQLMLFRKIQGVPSA